ncbi:MAG: o-succinylbenzoate synthase, partial [Gammaproteobacteria bacterium]|nr:o-succinylbenzoate synthase [Gammaproteobacteria bacterium]
ETWQQAKHWFSQNLQQLAGKSSDDIKQLLPTFSSAVACALDTALIDLLSQAENISISQWLNPECEDEVKTNINWGALNDVDPDTIIQQPVAPVIKIKLGLDHIQHEIKQLHKICKQLPSACQLRLDANQAWSYNDAQDFINQCNNLPIESIEEPLAQPDIMQLQKLQLDSPFPIALDESICQFNEDDLLGEKVVKKLMLKPMVVGGLRKTLKLANRAKAAGMESVITTTVDSAVGVWAAVHVAAALGVTGRDISHGLATSQWLKKDVAQPPLISDSEIKLNRKH